MLKPQSTVACIGRAQFHQMSKTGAKITSSWTSHVFGLSTEQEPESVHLVGADAQIHMNEE